MAVPESTAQKKSVARSQNPGEFRYKAQEGMLEKELHDGLNLMPRTLGPVPFPCGSSNPGPAAP